MLTEASFAIIMQLVISYVEFQLLTSLPCHYKMSQLFTTRYCNSADSNWSIRISSGIHWCKSQHLLSTCGHEQIAFTRLGIVRPTTDWRPLDVDALSFCHNLLITYVDVELRNKVRLDTGSFITHSVELLYINVELRLTVHPLQVTCCIVFVQHE